MIELSHRDNIRETDSDLTSSRIILSFMSIQFIAFFYYGGFRTIFPFILEYFNYSESQVVENWAFILTFGLIIGFFTRMPMGIVVDKISRKNSLVIGIIICSLSITLMLMTSEILMLAILFGLIRTGTHIFPLLTRAYVNETPADKQGRLNGFMLISANLAGFISPILLTILLSISFIWLVIFSNIVLYVVLLFPLLSVPKKSKRKQFSVKKILMKSIKELVKFKKAIFIMVLAGPINGVHNYMQVPYALYVLHLSHSLTSFVIGLVSINNIFFIVASGELINKLGVRKMVYLGSGLILSGAILISLLPTNVLTFAFGQMLIGGGILLNINSTVTLVTLRSSTETASTSFGGVSSFFFLGTSLIPFLAKDLYMVNKIYPYYFISLLSILFFFALLTINIQKRSNHNGRILQLYKK